jgi:hypothetical protein
MSRVIVELPLDRGYCGRLSAFDDSGRLVCGPFAVAARAGDARAQAEGNPRRNPLLRYGDTPTGSYRVTRFVRHEARAQGRFGPNGVLVIEATAGDAALAEANGRYRLFIQGGAASPVGSLRSTAGNLRLANADLTVLIAALGDETNVRVDIVAHEGLTAGDAVFVDESLQDEDPPEIPGAPSVLRDLFGEVSRRDALRAGAGGAAGLTALSLAVSFVSLGTPARAEVYTRMAYNEEGQATGNVPGGNTTTYEPGDERMTAGGPSPITGEGGQPISGAGVQPGPPDTPPPPNPTPSQPAFTPPPQQYTPPPSYAPPPSYTPPPSAPDSSPPSAPHSSGPSYTPPSYTPAPSQPAYTPPPPSSSTPAYYGDPRYIAAHNTVVNDQTAVANAQAALATLKAQRKSATDPSKQKDLDARIAAATTALGKASAQLATDQAALDALVKQLSQ